MATLLGVPGDVTLIFKSPVGYSVVVSSEGDHEKDIEILRRKLAEQAERNKELQ